MRTCDECKKGIGKTAVSCPHCGAYTTRGMVGAGCWFVLAIAGLFLLAIIAVALGA